MGSGQHRAPPPPAAIEDEAALIPISALEPRSTGQKAGRPESILPRSPPTLRLTRAVNFTRRHRHVKPGTRLGPNRFRPD